MKVNKIQTYVLDNYHSLINPVDNTTAVLIYTYFVDNKKYSMVFKIYKNGDWDVIYQDNLTSKLSDNIHWYIFMKAKQNSVRLL